MQKAGPLSELAPGEASEHVSPVAVFHTEEGELFAIDDTRSHQDASLADGWSKTAGSNARFTPHAFTWAPGPSRRHRPNSLSVHEVTAIDSDIMITESNRVPNLPLA